MGATGCRQGDRGGAWQSAAPGQRRRAAAALAAVALMAAFGGTAQAQTEGVQLRMSPSEPVVRRGEILTFQVLAENRSVQDFLRDNAAQGVELVLTTPRGLVWQPGSGRVTTVGGTVVPLGDPDGSTAAQVLTRRLEGGEAQRLNLGKDQVVVFRYQLVASSALAVDSVVTHRVYLRAGSGARLSLDVSARVRVEADPEFDEALVLGRVFCDGDGDGRPGAEEAGLGGVRVVADNGYRVDSDRDGRFHLRRFGPGMHLIKLDAASLPPGATLTTSDKVALYLTRGLVARAEFGVKCVAFEPVRPGTLTYAGLGAPGAVPGDTGEVELPSGPLPVVTVVGSVADGSVAVDARPLPALVARLGIEGKTRDAEGKVVPLEALNVPWGPGALGRPIVFLAAVSEETAAQPELAWRLEVARVDGPVPRAVRVFSGLGVPPASLRWDGTEAATTVGVLERGGRYEARLVVSDGRSGVATSAPVVIGASWGVAAAELAHVVVRGDLFNAKMEPTWHLHRAVEKANEVRAKTQGARLLVEVHTDATELEEADVTKTRRAAYYTKEWAAEKLGLKGDTLIAVGLGGARPLRPNIGERNRAFNRRVELVVLPPEDPDKLPALSRAASKPSVRIAGHEVELGADGRFVYTVARESGRPLPIVVRGADGAVRSVALGGEVPRVEVPEGPGDAAPAGDEPAPGAVTVDEGGALVVPADAETPVGLAVPREAEVSVSAPTAEPAESEVDAGAPADEPLATDALRRFGGRALRAALETKSILLGPDELAADGVAVTAGRLTVELPPKGIALSTTRLYVRGESDPRNTVTINGQRAQLDAQGRFAELVEVPSGASTLAIESRDAAGYVAQVSWPVTVADTEFFLLALADGVGGQVGARLEELGPYAKADNGTFYLAGRGAIYAKARISGGALAKDLFVTAHLDTAKKRDFSAFFDQVIDPGRDYVIFGDAAADVQDATARGPLYVLVEADRSKLTVGSIRTEFEGVHLLRYDRTFYGAKLDFEHAFAEGWDTSVKGFASEDNRTLVRRHDELRATGGSLYYLSSHEIVDGSEQVWIVVRELDTGLELGRTRLDRDAQYRVDYVTGRVTFASPVSSTMDALFQIDGYQPFTGRGVLDGHEVWVVVDYESRSVSKAGNIAAGVQAAQTIAGLVEVGGSYVREGRPAGSGAVATGDEDYALYGAHVKVKLSERSTVFAEFAHSSKADGISLASTDGGLLYRELRRAAERDSGNAMKLGLDARVGEIFDVPGLDLRVQGWWQLLDSGFHAVGLAEQRGSEAFGGSVAWRITPEDRVDLRYDGGTTLVADPYFDTGERAVKRNRLHARYAHDFGLVEAFTEGGFGQHRDDGDGAVYDTGALAVGGRVRITPRLGAVLSQEALIGGDDAIIGAGFTDRMTTTVGVDYKLADDLSLRLLESVRWNGDNATRAGVRTRLDDLTSVYFEDRLAPGDDNGRLVHALVIGAESVVGADKSGRAYGEYRLDTGVDGRTNRAVMGLGRRLQLAPGVRLTGAYERSQAVSGAEAGLARDVLSAGLEVLVSDIARFGGLYEVRLDHPGGNSEAPEKVQALARNAVDLKLGDDVTLMGIVNYSITQNLDSRDFDQEDLEATAGVAWRPERDDVTLLARYSRLVHRTRTLDGTTMSLGGLGGVGGLGTLGNLDTLSGLGLLGGLGTSEEKSVSDLFTVAAIIELPWRLQLTEKLAWRHTNSQVSGMPDSDYDLLLWVNRLAFHLLAGLDLAGEFRMVASLGDLAALENGGLVEVAYTFYDFVRLGVGYRINGVAGELLPGTDGNDVADGLYVRLTGTY